MLINGENRLLTNFIKQSRYIMQEDVIQTMLTVEEAMKTAADLKLGWSTTDTYKYAIVKLIYFDFLIK